MTLWLRFLPTLLYSGCEQSFLIEKKTDIHVSCEICVRCSYQSHPFVQGKLKRRSEKSHCFANDLFCSVKTKLVDNHYNTSGHTSVSIRGFLELYKVGNVSNEGVRREEQIQFKDLLPRNHMASWHSGHDITVDHKKFSVQSPLEAIYFCYSLDKPLLVTLPNFHKF